jgi:hypothetical protein
VAPALDKRDGPEASIEIDEKARGILSLLEGESTIGELVEEACKRQGLRRHEAARAIYRLREAGMVRMRDPSPPRSLARFILSSRATWLWILISAVAITDLSIYASSILPQLSILRIPLGTIFVLYLPGASLIELLYPKREDLTQLERLALSIGLSLALVPLVGLILNYTPWGIRLDPIVASLTILTLTMAFGAAARKHSHHLLAQGG